MTRPTLLDLADRRFVLGLGLVVLAALALRLVFLTHYSLSLDEAFARYWIERPQEFLWGEGRQIETNPPLYFSLLRGWTQIFGTGDAALRLPSVLVSTAVVALTGIMGRMAAGPAVGLLAAALLGIWPLSLWHALDARPVALTPLFQALALLGCLGVLRHGGDRLALRLLWGALFVFGAACGIYTHATSLFFAAALGGVTALTSLAEPRRRRANLILWAGLGAALLLLALPQLLVFGGQRSAGTISWIPPLSVWMLQTFFVPLGLGLGGFELGTLPRLALAGLLFALAAFGATSLRDRASLAVMVAAPLLYLALLIGVSAFRPILLPRVAVILLTPLAILIAAAILRFQAPAWRIVTLAPVAGTLLLGLGLQLRDPASIHLAHTLRPDYRGIVRLIAEQPGCGGDVFSGHLWTLQGWPHYGRPPEGTRLAAVLFPEEEDVRLNRYAQGYMPLAGIEAIPVEAFRTRIEAAAQAVILVQRSPPSSPAMRAIIDGLGGRFSIERHVLGGGNSEVVAFCLRRR